MTKRDTEVALVVADVAMRFARYRCALEGRPWYSEPDKYELGLAEKLVFDLVSRGWKVPDA